MGCRFKLTISTSSSSAQQFCGPAPFTRLVYAAQDRTVVPSCGPAGFPGLSCCTPLWLRAPIACADTAAGNRRCKYVRLPPARSDGFWFSAAAQPPPHSGRRGPRPQPHLRRATQRHLRRAPPERAASADHAAKTCMVKPNRPWTGASCAGLWPSGRRTAHPKRSRSGHGAPADHSSPCCRSRQRRPARHVPLWLCGLSGRSACSPSVASVVMTERTSVLRTAGAQAHRQMT